MHYFHSLSLQKFGRRKLKWFFSRKILFWNIFKNWCGFNYFWTKIYSWAKFKGNWSSDPKRSGPVLRRLSLNLGYYSFKVLLRFVIGWNRPVNSSWIASDDKFWKPNAIKFASCVCLVVWAYFLISIRWAYSYFKKRCRRKSKKASRKDCKVMWIVYLWLFLEKSQSTKLAADFFIHHLY